MCVWHLSHGICRINWHPTNQTAIPSKALLNPVAAANFSTKIELSCNTVWRLEFFTWNSKKNNDNLFTFKPYHAHKKQSFILNEAYDTWIRPCLLVSWTRIAISSLLHSIPCLNTFFQNVLSFVTKTSVFFSVNSFFFIPACQHCLLSSLLSVA